MRKPLLTGSFKLSNAADSGDKKTPDPEPLRKREERHDSNEPASLPANDRPSSPAQPAKPPKSGAGPLVDGDNE